MKGIIVAAGKGTRLGLPCKALAKIRGKYLIEYPLDVMKKSHIREVIIIQHGRRIEKAIGNTYRKMKITYVQQKERRGIAHAISLTEKKVNGDDVLIILGDVVYNKNVLSMMDVFYECKCVYPDLSFVCGGIEIKDKNLLKTSYGIITKGRFVEKPKKVSRLSSILGLGIYVASNNIFNNFKKQKPSKRGELEITDALNIGKSFICLLSGKYININTPEDLKKI
jgi:glucose-1-phosphate thymidylyltransferase